MMAGNARPNVDKQKAPNNEMKRSKLGMAMASKTAKGNLELINLLERTGHGVDALTCHQHNGGAN